MYTNKRWGRGSAVVFIIALCIMLTLPAQAESAPAATPENGFVTLSYRLLYEGGVASKVKKGDAVSIEILIKSTTLKTNDIDTTQPIDASSMVGSYAPGGAPQVELRSQGEEALQLKLLYPNCTYNGTGKSFPFMVGCRKAGAAQTSYQQMELVTTEAEEYTPTAPVPELTPTPVQTTPPTIPAPVLRIARSEVPTLTAGEEVTVVLQFTNIGNVPMENALASVSTSEALLLLENTSSFLLGNLAPGGFIEIPMRFRVAKSVAAEQQTITVDAKFNYFNGDQRAQGTASDKLNLQAKATAQETPKPDGPVPNIILQKYTLSDPSGQAAAGSEFEIKLDFMNTSTKRKTENVVMTVEAGEGLSLNNSANTFYYAALDKEEARSETIKLLTLPTAKPGAGEITLTFKYEYVDNNKRSPVTLTQKLSVQIFQPDRFDVTLNTPPQTVTAGEETTVSLSYMNKGKSEVANVQAKFEGDVAALGSVQNIGNLDPGKSGSINFVLTPAEAGEVACKIVISYEDAGAHLKSKEIPVTLTVEEPYVDPALTEGMTMEEEPKSGGLLWYILGGVLLCGGGVTAVILRRKKQSKKKGRKSSYEWKDETEG